MILNYLKSFENPLLREYKKYNINYFKASDFKKYKKEQEEADREIVILRNTRLKELSEDSKEVTEDKEYLDLGDKKYELIKARKCIADGYICVGENMFVCIEQPIFLVIILWFGLFLGLLGLFFALFRFLPENIIKPPALDKEDETDWDGNPFTSGENSVANQEVTVIPGYADIIAKSGQSAVPLYNPDENTVYMVYTITEKVNTEIVGHYSDIAEAQGVVNENKVEYENVLESGVYKVKDKATGETSTTYLEYKVISSASGGYDVEKSESNVLYFTKAIAPGNKASEDWDIKQSLGTGEHEVQFRISTYDIDTESMCYGAVVDVNIKVLD